MNYKILVVDDESANTRMLERLLRDQYEVVTAQSGDEGLEALNIHDIALIISDQRMPGMTGVEFLKRSAEVRPHCVRIILTGYTDAADLVDALNSGVVYKYVTKPWVNTDLLQTVKRGLSHHETIKAQHRLNLENERLHERLDTAEGSLLNLCFEILSLKNARARERAPRVRDLALMVGRALKLETSSLETLSTAAYLHAIADVYVPNGLASRKDKLSEGEKTFVASARQKGLELLDSIPGAQEIIEAVRYLPEHFNGSGWPDGLGSIQIPLSSRIIAVAKAYDELIFPDSEALGVGDGEALIDLRSRASKQLDPHIVKAFCGLMVANQMQRIVPQANLLVFA